jgi:hypothetical protein
MVMLPQQIEAFPVKMKLLKQDAQNKNAVVVLLTHNTTYSVILQKPWHGACDYARRDVGGGLVYWKA